jgi:Kef-type K+ transport system membrane component KefB
MSKSARYVLYAAISLTAATLWFGPAWASGGEGGHGGLGEILFTLVIILLSAKLGGHLMERVGQPSVLGELIFGVIIGNIYLLGFHGFESLKGHEAVTVMAEIGVILLLFEVGLESTVGEMMKVGVSSLLVALLGIVAPFFLGWGVSAWLLPAESIYVHIFIGATLTATSVGITARVLKDMGRLQDKESRIVLGAAVIDDVLGLVILAVVSGIIAAADSGGDSVSTSSVIWIVAKAFIFLVGSIVLGGFLFPRILNMTLRLRGTGVLLTMALVFCFAMAWLAELAGLASIVGAFAAGLILEQVHVKKYRERGEHELEELIKPLAVFLTPIFFVNMGMDVDLRTFGQVDVLAFAGALTIAAIFGKQVASLGVTEKGLNKLAVGLGMIPRGEVGLIFASIGATLYIQGDRVIDPSIYSAVVIMVIITTMVTPPVLKIAMEKKR